MPRASQAPFELADVGVDLRREMDRDVAGKVQAVDFGLLFENRDARLHVRRLKVGDQAPLEAVAKALFEPGDVLRDLVGREDDLPVRFVQRIERVEELLLRSLAVGQELNVVDDQTSIFRNVDLNSSMRSRRRAVISWVMKASALR